MCGRYGLKTSFSTLAKLLRAEPVGDDELGPDWGPDYNIAPTDRAPVLMAGADGERQLALYRWGLVPFWADDPKVGARMINARADTIQTKPAFRDAFRERRLLVPASGWFEWEAADPHAIGEAKKPQPHWIHASAAHAVDSTTTVVEASTTAVVDTPPASESSPESANEPGDEPVLLFAGLWSKWKDKASGETRRTFTILTTDAAPSTRAIHDRMPVIVPASAQALWLAPDAQPAELTALLVPYPGRLAHHRVAKTVNTVRADGPVLITSIDAAPEPTRPPAKVPKAPKGQGDLPL